MGNSPQDKSTRELKWLPQTVEEALNFFFWEFVFQCCQSVIHQPTVSLEVCVAMEGVSGMCLSAVLKAWLKTLNTWGHKLVQGLLILFYIFSINLLPLFMRLWNSSDKGLFFYGHTEPSWSLWKVIILIWGRKCLSFT